VCAALQINILLDRFDSRINVIWLLYYFIIINYYCHSTGIILAYLLYAKKMIKFVCRIVTSSADAQTVAVQHV